MQTTHQTLIVQAAHQLRSVALKCTLVVLVALNIGLLGCSAELGDGRPGVLGCAGNTVDCGQGVCVDLESDTGSCGACGEACAQGQFCDAGQCTGYCAPGQEDCAGVCQGVQSDPAACGGCGVACAPGEFCDQASCSSECSGVLCPGPEGFGICAHLGSDPSHCGQCGAACGPGFACEEGSCVTACPPGRERCGAECVDLRTTAAHCGACGNSCESGVACVEGSCGGTCVGPDCACGAGQTACAGACVTTIDNPFHCGDCGVACATGQTCQAGDCVCPGAELLCGSSCVDAQADNNNCGKCGEACAGGQSCQSGSCACQGVETACDGLCVNTDLSASHCGVCGHACDDFESCEAGLCRFKGPDGDNCGGAAVGIDISRVAFYQAVELDLFSGGQAISKAARPVDVVRGKNAMVRVFTALKAGSPPREISARLHVTNGTETKVLHHRRTVSGASTQESLESTFRIPVPADLISEATKYFVELVECQVPPTGTVGQARVPAGDGQLDLEARATGVIKVVFVPIEHDGILPDTSATAQKLYADAVLSQYPTTAVQTSVSDKIASQQSGKSVNLGSVLELVRTKRASLEVAADVYVYGLIKPASSFGSFCGGGCTTGVAYITGTSSWSAASRAGVGIGFADSVSAETFVHELGHNHERSHAPCGTTGDASFPHAGAKIGTWGFDLVGSTLKSPSTYKDFMSYCDPTWVSDYTYRALTERVAKLNGNQSQEFQRLGPEVTWEVMVVGKAGPVWGAPYTTRLVPDGPSETAWIYDNTGEVIATTAVYRVEMSEEQGFILYVPEAQPGWYALGLPEGPALLY